LATQRVAQPGSYTFPPDGIRADSAAAKELYLLFSRAPLNNANRALALTTVAPGRATSVVTTVAEPAPPVSFSITLKYK
jgi:hypothetical protein